MIPSANYHLSRYRTDMRYVVAFAVLLGLALALPLHAKEAPMSLYDLTANTLAGKPQPLSAYKGKVALVVNTASECGYTPQYAGLEKLYEEYKDRGLVVLGFPSNDFGAQEPGSAEQITTFCKKNYGVQFPMFEKVAVKGAAQSPVYKLLTAKLGEPKWNFHKYLVGKDGQVLKAFPSKVTPDAKELREAIDAALKD
jgi:glutathione peroxidase